MHFVSSIAASACSTALGVVGLAVAGAPPNRSPSPPNGHALRHKQDLPIHPDRIPTSTSITSSAATVAALLHSHQDMTTTTTATAVATLPSPFATTTIPSTAAAAASSSSSSSTHRFNVPHASNVPSRSRSSSTTKLVHKRHGRTSPSSGVSLGAGMEHAARREERARASDTPNPGPPTSNAKWFRRLSSSLSTSTSRDFDSNRSRSRPGSAALSYTNGSVALSHSGSTTPICTEASRPQTAPLAPNKLVKRNSSLRNSNDSPGSRIPVFRKPPTSRQRAATLSEGCSRSLQTPMRPLSGSIAAADDGRWRSYFTPRIAVGAQAPFPKRRGSTGIPNPVRRVYPDRKYTPTLVLANEVSRPVIAAMDHGDDDDDMMNDHERAVTLANAPPFSPSFTPATQLEGTASPRRSFSIGDLLSTGPQQQLWQRPSSKGRPWSSRSLRRVRASIGSDPRVQHMGGHLSKPTDPDTGRPSKRRVVSDPTSSQRSISSSSSNYAVPRDHIHQVELHLSADSPRREDTPELSRPSSRAQTPDCYRSSFASQLGNGIKTLRRSNTHSDVESLPDSDSESQSLGDNSTDYQSDHYYDSIRTRTTRSSSGRRGPPIETIFDESPPTFSSGRSTKLRDFLSDGHDQNERYSTIEEEGSVLSTPVRSLHNKSVASTPSGRPGAPLIFSSSPPVMNIMPDPDDVDWDMGDEDERMPTRRLGIPQHASMPSFNLASRNQTLPFRFGPALKLGNSRSANSTPRRNVHSPRDKTSLFDWAEPQPFSNNSPPRPRTVHGKKDQDMRGSRASGRRPASGMHARSHSVPVVPDQDSKHSVIANKFGTWGVGSKGVTEDWNEDFDFDEPTLPIHSHLEQDDKRIDSAHEMFVPKSIREQQQNVVANIGLLREWGLLIEELKELRIRAAALNMFKGPYAEAWQEVDAMIELADQESEEQTLQPRRTPPSSPGFDITAFDDQISKIDERPRNLSGSLSPLDATNVSPSPLATRTTQSGHSPVVTRPRKDSELVAQKVIAALQSKRTDVGFDPSQPGGSTNKKVPFDTATLRHIVPYVSGLKRKVKDALRETEGLYSSPNRRKTSEPLRPSVYDDDDEEEPAFRSIFNSPQDDDVTTRRQSRREQAVTDHDGSDWPLPDQSTHLSEKLQQMKLA